MRRCCKNITNTGQDGVLGTKEIQRNQQRQASQTVVGVFREQTLSFTQQPERAISQADKLLDYKSWDEDVRKMFSQLRMREEQALLAQDYALEQARAESIEKGLERGLEQGLERGKLLAFLDMVRKHLLTAEVASEQLGMTVAEFEALL